MARKYLMSVFVVSISIWRVDRSEQGLCSSIFSAILASTGLVMDIGSALFLMYTAGAVDLPSILTWTVGFSGSVGFCSNVAESALVAAELWSEELSACRKFAFQVLKSASMLV